MAVAAALPVVLATPVVASAQPVPVSAHASRAVQVEEAVVNCVDDNRSNQVTGDNLFVLTNLDPQETENVPANTTQLTCTNEATSNVPVEMTVTFSDHEKVTERLDAAHNTNLTANNPNAVAESATAAVI
ncbi:hypothetical protein [Streptomyces natalensis]|uniref:Uncharacterized protein n=1 Tax=Streptomyces natalensis ATCC 27448 TaxID=1240678 RepID=A0A0D7CHL9_9ACTN|nr:hypothetical protein [Streptomyces natalensis]KIZ15739.1 hypothetical protein SNA_25090 [Streptomyces natalensis ATCC 27448]